MNFKQKTFNIVILLKQIIYANFYRFYKNIILAFQPFLLFLSFFDSIGFIFMKTEISFNSQKVY